MKPPRLKNSSPLVGEGEGEHSQGQPRSAEPVCNIACAGAHVSAARSEQDPVHVRSAEICAALPVDAQIGGGVRADLDDGRLHKDLLAGLIELFDDGHDVLELLGLGNDHQAVGRLVRHDGHVAGDGLGAFLGAPLSGQIAQHLGQVLGLGVLQGHNLNIAQVLRGGLVQLPQDALDAQGVLLAGQNNDRVGALVRHEADLSGLHGLLLLPAQ